MTCDVRFCEEPATWLVEPGAYLCDRHNRPPERMYVCKHCGCAIASRIDTMGNHGSTCPRRGPA